MTVVRENILSIVMLKNGKLINGNVSLHLATLEPSCKPHINVFGLKISNF